MRIALLSRFAHSFHGYGGVERHVYYLARHLTRQGVEIHLFTQPPWTQARMDEPGVIVHFISAAQLPVGGVLDRITNYPWFVARLGKAVASEVAERRIDLVHAQGLTAFGYAWERERDQSLSAPLLMNPQGMEEFKTPNLAKRAAYTPFRALFRYSAQHADCVIATDACTVDDIPCYLGVPLDHTVVLLNAVDVDECLAWVSEEGKAEVVRRFDLAGRRPILLSVGRLQANKGFVLLVEALGRLHSELPTKWLWVLWGMGPERSRIESRIAALGLGDHVRLTGHIDDMTLHNLYEVANLFVVPTLYEGSSIVTLEAMVHRKPIVASATGGIPDKVIPGMNGYLTRPGDVDDLAGKLITCLRQEPRWGAMGETSLQMVREKFAWPSIARATIDVYERLLTR